jgi:isomerase DpgB
VAKLTAYADVTIDGELSLQVLTKSVLAGCDQVGDRVLVLRMRHATCVDRPGQTHVHAVSKWEQTLRKVELLSAPTIAVAEGHCGSVAMEMLLACDYRIVTPDTMLALSRPNGGFWPGMVVHRLANQLGVARARRMVLHGAEITAARALQLDLVDVVTDDVPGALSTAGRLLTQTPGPELAIRRRLLLEASSASFEDALGAHLAACDRELRRSQ